MNHEQVMNEILSLDKTFSFMRVYLDEKVTVELDVAYFKGKY